MRIIMSLLIVLSLCLVAGAVETPPEKPLPQKPNPADPLPDKPVPVKPVTQPALKEAAEKITAAATQVAAASTQASAATTAPAGDAQAAAPTTFPTPAELIAKMRSMKKEKAALPHVAYFDLSDVIVEKPADFSLFGDPDTTTLKSLVDRLRKAKDDKDIRAVLITLGAESQLNLAQAHEICQTLQDLSKSGKPTFVHADSFDTASYIAACGADHVCMLEGGDILIPGVGMEAMFAKGLLDKVGVKADYVQIGEYKGADEELTRTDASEQLKGEMNRLSDALYEQIVETISLSRNLPSADVRDIIDDTMLNGAAAKSRGLVDHLIDQDGLRALISSELRSNSKQKDKTIEIVHNYGKPEHEDVDFSNPFSLFATMAQRRQQTSDKPQIALIYVSGVITDGESGTGLFGGDFVGSEDLRKALRHAAKDGNIKAVVFRIDSPGGSALASEVVWQAARRLAEEKPLVVSVGSMAASGGYYIASASPQIYADPGAIVGSIGVVGGKFVYAELMSKLGITTESFSRGRNANLFSSTQPFTERQRKMVTSWMKQTYNQFTERVLVTRKEKIKHIDDVARGRIFVAKQAKNVGLIDEIGGLQQALADAAKRAHMKDGEYDVKVLPAPKTLADIFALGGSADAQAAVRRNVTISPDSILHMFDRVTQRAFGQQLQAIQLLQRHPVLLVTPYVISIR